MATTQQRVLAYPITFTARIGDVLGWDQRECSVLLVHGEEAAREFCRAHRDEEFEITISPRRT